MMVQMVAAVELTAAGSRPAAVALRQPLTVANEPRAKAIPTPVMCRMDQAVPARPKARKPPTTRNATRASLVPQPSLSQVQGISCST